MKIRYLLILAILTSIAYSAQSGNLKLPKRMNAFKIEQKLNLDGKLSESFWKGEGANGFIQRDPDEGKPATEKTNVWVAYDETNLYVAARLYDSKPQDIDASLARRDDNFNSDWFLFFVDPYHDKKTGYYFGVNAGGSMIDGVLFNDSWDNNTWDGIWEVKTNIDDEGWTLEMRIPFTQLRFEESDVMTWGVNFKRERKANNEASYFVMIPRTESGFVSHFAELEGLKGIKPKQRFEILPYVVQKAKFLDHDDDDPFYKENQFPTNLGADIKIGVGSNMTLDATLNPDFGQVEVDPAVVNLSAFETYFDEKRPFFIEGDNIFYFGVGGSNSNWGFNFGNPEMFYSRRVGRNPQGDLPDEFDDYSTDRPSETRIIGAAKLTGKLNETTSIGAISAFTERTFATIYNDERRERNNFEIEPFTHYGVLRSKKEFNGGHQGLGLMFTSVNRDLKSELLRESLSDQAYVAGLDGWTFLDDDKKYVITAYGAYSYTSGTKDYITNLQERSYHYLQRPDRRHSKLDSSLTSLSGYYTRIMANKQSGNFYFNTALGVVSPTFENNDLGFQWMSDRINGHFVAGYRWYEPDGIFRRKEVYASHFRTFDYDGNQITNGLWSRGSFILNNYYAFGYYGSFNYPTYDHDNTRGGPLMLDPHEYGGGIWVETDSREKLMFEASVEQYGDDFGAKYTRYYVLVTWKPSPQLFFEFKPRYVINTEDRQWVDNFDDPTAIHTHGGRYVFAELDQETISASFRLNWTFSPTLSLQTYIQPLFSVGKYSRFKEFAVARTDQMNIYGEDNNSTISYDAENEEYTVDPDGPDGEAEEITFEDPDFNFKSFRANVVLRWEVLPGSIFYFAWTHDQTHDGHPGDLDFNRDFKDLWNSPTDDVFLVKFSYWFDM